MPIFAAAASGLRPERIRVASAAIFWALARFTRPPANTRSGHWGDGTEATINKLRRLSGCRCGASTRHCAATDDTLGAAIEVPLIFSYRPPETVERMKPPRIATVAKGNP